VIVSLKIVKKKIVVIGGGTGTYTVLLGLKKYSVQLSAVIGMTDSGGSNRVIRDEFGLLPTSDLRQCMVALASENSDVLLRKLFTYRYNQGRGISGMTFGNLFMAALSDIYSSQEKAIEETCRILHVQGNIIPVTYDDVHLIARYENGKEVLGEHMIDEPSERVASQKIISLRVTPRAKANPQAVKAISEANLIVIGPGDLYTSLVCNLVIDGIPQAIQNSKAKKIYIVNLMTRHGQTDNFSAADHLNVIEKYLGPGVIDYILINNSLKYPKGILNRYKKEKAFPVKDNLKGDYRTKRAYFISDKIYQKPKSDKLVRSLIRHDSNKLAKMIMSLV